jgi:hypothetical protein
LKISQLNILLPKRTLLLLALGLFLLSFITAYYFKIQPSINYQQKKLERYIQQQEKEAKSLLADTILMRKLVLQKESLEQFKFIEAKRFGFFLFAETISDNQNLLFWNSQKVLPPETDFNLRDGTYFQHLTNGYYVVRKTTLQLEGMTNNVVAYV